MSPEVGFSRPAMERSVVVFPQPEGPSRVNSLPSGTSNETSCAAFTTVPLSLGYSVYSDLTFSTFVVLVLILGNTEPLADELRDHHQAEQHDDQHHAER